MDGLHISISVIIINWNSKEYLSRCLSCLSAQTVRDYEVILIDNGSTDGSLDGVENRWPGLDLRIEELDENRGRHVGPGKRGSGQ